MSRLRYNNQNGTLGASLTNSGTTLTFTAAPDFATIVSPDYIPIGLDYGTTSFEVVYLTAYTAGATTGTITRAAEDATHWPAVAHSSGSGTWAVAVTVYDFTTGVPNGLAALDANGLVPLSELPSTTTNIVFPTSGQPASGTGLNGDLAFDPTTLYLYAKASGAWSAASQIANSFITYGSSTATTLAAGQSVVVIGGAFSPTITLPAPVINGSCRISNSGTGTVTVQPPSGLLYSTAGATGNQTLAAAANGTYASNGTNWYRQG